MDEKFDMKEILEKEDDADGRHHPFDYLRVTFADLHGIARSQSVPRRHAQKYLENGMSLFAGLLSVGPRSDVTAVLEIDETHMSNCNFLPVSGSFHELPWATVPAVRADGNSPKYRIGEVFCESYWIKPYRDGAPQDACTRYVARKQLDRLKELGYSLKSSYEAEFLVYDKLNMKPVFQGSDAGTSLRLGEFEEYLCDMEKKLNRSGVDIVSMIIEHGEGQFEFGMIPVEGIKAADIMFLLKQGVKEMTQQRGWIATFMARPFLGSTTTGLHLNHSVWSSTGEAAPKNEFYDSEKPDGLSDLHRHWIAGLLTHAKAMTALCCPTINCYRRLHGFLSPDKVEWGIDDRLVAFRAKSYSHSATYIESRISSGACNPYLALACTVAAGIDGIANRLECPAPRKEGIAELMVNPEGQLGRKEDTAENTYLPYSLEEALECLEKDDVIKTALGEEFVRWFVQAKHENEIKVVEGLNDEQRFSKERELYFEFL